MRDCAWRRLLERRCTLSHPPFRRRLSGYQSGVSLEAMAFFLAPVNCPDLHYPRSRISMAFLAHLQTFTWIAWIPDREPSNKGIRLDSTQQSWPPMRPRIMEPRGLLRGAWVGQRNKWTWPTSALPLLQCCERHDVVVNFCAACCYEELAGNARGIDTDPQADQPPKLQLVALFPRGPLLLCKSCRSHVLCCKSVPWWRSLSNVLKANRATEPFGIVRERTAFAALPSSTVPCPLSRERSQRWQTKSVAHSCCGPQSVVDMLTAAKRASRTGWQHRELN